MTTTVEIAAVRPVRPVRPDMAIVASVKHVHDGWRPGPAPAPVPPPPRPRSSPGPIRSSPGSSPGSGPGPGPGPARKPRGGPGPGRPRLASMTASAASPVPAAELARVRAFLADSARRQAPRVLELPGGFAVLNAELPHSRVDNQLFVDRAVPDPDALPALVDRALDGLAHRLVTALDDRAGEALAGPLSRAGYEHTVDLLMVHRGPVPALGTGPRRAGTVGLDALRGPLTRRWRGFLPDADEETLRQLVERRTVRLRCAPVVHFVGSRAEDGEVASWADLYLDPAAGLAQIEDVLTAEAHLGRGHGNAVLAEALRLAADAGCGTRFLIAEADDWPRDWYERLGFGTIGRVHCFERG